MNDELFKDLPPARTFQCLPWDRWFGVDFYGALDVAAAYCGMRSVPPLPPGTWQHGLMPPWQQVQAEILVYGAPQSLRCFVGRKDEVDFLRHGGYTNVHAIGLPITYTQTSTAARIPKSVLIMPAHITAEMEKLPETQDYLREVAQLKERFSVVAACVSQACIAKGLWARDFEALGIPVVPGAGLYDANALRRMRTLFERFETVTTNGYGSHILYALCFGARVSLWGPEHVHTLEDLLCDPVWKRFPDAARRYLSRETKDRAEGFLKRFRVPPEEAVGDVEFGRRMVGWENRRSPDEIKELFGWTRRRLLVCAAGRRMKRSLPWRGAAWLKRNLIP